MSTSNLQKRKYLFLLGCIPTRLLFMYIAMKSSPDNLPYLGFIALIPAIGFMCIYLSGSRQTGPEVFGDVIWWNHLRPLHSVLYALFAYNAIYGNKAIAWRFLALDAALGLGSFIHHHYS